MVYFLSRFNMVIRFWPGHLRKKPDTLSRCPDLYPKGEGRSYGTVNPQNCCPVFSSTQGMFPAILHGVLAMDIEELQKDILSAYDTDPAVQSLWAGLDNTRYS